MFPELVLNGKCHSFKTFLANITRDPHNLLFLTLHCCGVDLTVTILMLRLGSCQGFSAPTLHVNLSIGMKSEMCLQLSFRAKIGFTHHTFMAGGFLGGNLLGFCQHILWDQLLYNFGGHFGNFRQRVVVFYSAVNLSVVRIRRPLTGRPGKTYNYCQRKRHLETAADK